MSEFAPYVKALEASELRERVLREQLIATQAREAKLREALGKYRGQVDRFGEHTSVEALAIPTDDSALMERLREERERVIKVCEQWDVNQHCIDEIRSLT